MVVIDAGDDPPKKDPTPKYAYFAEQLMKSDSAYYAKRLAHTPEPNRWNESLEMLNDLYNESSVSKETFEKIKCSVLIMCGDSDQYGKLKSFLAAYQSISDSRLAIIPGCDHMVFYGNFPAVWESIKIFLGFTD